MLAEDLKKAIYQAAVQGKIVEQCHSEGDGTDFLLKIGREGRVLESLTEVSNEEIPFDIPDSWCWVKLDDIATISSGSTPLKSKEEYYRNGTIGWCTSTVTNEELVITPNNFITEIAVKECNLKIYPPGTILMAMYGQGKTRGQITELGISTTVNQACAAIQLIDQSESHREYIKICLKEVYNKIRSEAAGGAQPNLNGNKIKKILIPIPPLKEQARIAKKVKEVIDEINQYETLEKELKHLKQAFPEDLKKSLLQAATQGKLVEQHDSDGDVDELIDCIISERERLIKEKVIKKTKALEPITEEETPFDIPDNWRWIRFGDLVNFKIGKTPPRKEPVHWNGDYQWVSIADMIADGYINETKESISQYGFENSFNGVFSPKGTLLMSFKLTVGKVSILDIDAIHNEAIISIFPYLNKGDIMRDYLFKTLPFLSKFGDSKGAIKGDTLNSTSLNNLLIPLPPLEEQKRIVEKLESLLPLCDELI